MSNSTEDKEDNISVNENGKMRSAVELLIKNEQVDTPASGGETRLSEKETLEGIDLKNHSDSILMKFYDELDACYYPEY